MTMVRQYEALAVQNTFWGIQNRSDIKRNIGQVSNLIGAAIWLSELEAPVRLVALSEGALTGFTDEVFDYEHTRAAKELNIEIPGEETDLL